MISLHTYSLSLILGLLLAAAAAAAETPPAAPTGPPAVAEITDPLILLNLASRGFYARARETMLAHAGPIIMLQGDTLTLMHGDKRVTGSFASSDYDTLKTYSHIALALDVMLITDAGEGEIDAATLELLRQYRGLIEAAQKQIDEIGLSKEQIARQNQLVNASLKFIDKLLEQRTCSVAERQAFIRGLMPLIMANMNEAAQAQLNAIDALVRQWRQEMPADDWKQVRVVILGRQLPRKDNLAVQYFARLLGVPGEGNRLVYAESITDEPRALELLGTNLLDTQIGIDFFDDPLRMKRDLLGDAAREYIPKLFAEDQSTRP